MRAGRCHCFSGRQRLFVRRVPVVAGTIPGVATHPFILSMVSWFGDELIIEKLRGESGVPAYRIYKLDGDGRFATAEWIEADGDDTALETARSSARQAHRFELWQGSRLVARVNEPPPGSDPS